MATLIPPYHAHLCHDLDVRRPLADDERVGVVVGGGDGRHEDIPVPQLWHRVTGKDYCSSELAAK